MAQYSGNQLLNKNLSTSDNIQDWINAFLLDRKVKNLAPGSLKIYGLNTKHFLEFCSQQNLSHLKEITPDHIRHFLLFLSETKGRNPGGIHGAYRMLKTFLLWFENETEPENWKNPIRKVKAPRLTIAPLQPVEVDTIKLMLDTCNGKGITDIRDKAVLLFLLDTGTRAAEACAINLEDIDFQSRCVLIKKGKGRKPRVVVYGEKTSRALKAYIKARAATTEKALWLAEDSENRLTYWGMNEIIKRRAKRANVEKPGLHDFRRAFAINFLRNGGDIYSLQTLMGHADLQVLRRYLAQTEADLRSAHAQNGPVDRLLG